MAEDRERKQSENARGDSPPRERITIHASLEDGVNSKTIKIDIDKRRVSMDEFVSMAAKRLGIDPRRYVCLICRGWGHRELADYSWPDAIRNGEGVLFRGRPTSTSSHTERSRAPAVVETSPTPTKPT